MYLSLLLLYHEVGDRSIPKIIDNIRIMNLIQCMEVSYSGDIYTILASYEILCEEEEQKAKADRVKYRIVKGLNQSGKPIFRIIETPPFGKRVAIRAADILKAMATTPYRQTEERLVELALHRLRIDSDKSVNNMVRQRLIEECISVDRDLLNDLLNDF